MGLCLHLSCPALSCVPVLRACLIMYNGEYITISEPSFADRVYLRLFYLPFDLDHVLFFLGPGFLAKRDRACVGITKDTYTSTVCLIQG